MSKRCLLWVIMVLIFGSTLTARANPFIMGTNEKIGLNGSGHFFGADETIVNGSEGVHLKKSSNLNLRQMGFDRFSSGPGKINAGIAFIIMVAKQLSKLGETPDTLLQAGLIPWYGPVSLQIGDLGALLCELDDMKQLQCYPIMYQTVPITYRSDSFPPSAVPEPATILLVGIGLVLFSRRRNHLKWVA